MEVSVETLMVCSQSHFLNERMILTHSGSKLEDVMYPIPSPFSFHSATM